MAQRLCEKCGENPAGLRKNGRTINIRGFDYCPECNNGALDNLQGKPTRYTNRKPEELVKVEEVWRQYKREIECGTTPALVDPLFHRRHVIFSREFSSEIVDTKKP